MEAKRIHNFSEINRSAVVSHGWAAQHIPLKENKTEHVFIELTTWRRAKYPIATLSKFTSLFVHDPL